MFLQVSMTFGLTLNKPKNVFVLLFAYEGLQIKVKDKLVPGLIRAYVRTYVRTYVHTYVRTYGRMQATTKFSWLDEFPIFYGYGAPPTGAFGARGSSATNDLTPATMGTLNCLPKQIFNVPSNL